MQVLRREYLAERDATSHTRPTNPLAIKGRWLLAIEKWAVYNSTRYRYELFSRYSAIRPPDPGSSLDTLDVVSHTRSYLLVSVGFCFWASYLPRLFFPPLCHSLPRDGETKKVG